MTLRAELRWALASRLLLSVLRLVAPEAGTDLIQALQRTAWPPRG